MKEHPVLVCCSRWGFLSGWLVFRSQNLQCVTGGE